MEKQNDILQPVSIEEVQKMLKVKSLALEKLESELEIETALERVRVVAMSMKKSEELFEVCKVMYEELTALNFTNIRNAQIAINLGEYKSWLIFEYSKYGEIKMKKVDSGISPLLKEIAEEMSTAKDVHRLFQKQIKGEEFKKWRAWRLKEDALKDPGVDKANSMCFYLHGIEAGILGISSFDAITNEQVEILNRFKNVFDLSYRRYADVANAEAQAREAQIEAALEKVRSRSLAMHKSDELQEVVNTVFERLKDLNIEMDSANIAIFIEGSRDFEYWIASPSQKRTASFHMPYTELLLTRDWIAARESGADFSSKAYSFEEKNEWFNWAFKHTDFNLLTEERKQFILDASAITVSVAFSKYTGLQVIRYSTRLLSEAEAEILKRFSRVFEQAYIRFNDLQQAEAQARESQIQLALERVRARTMAMQKSEELKEVIQSVYDQFGHLNIHIEHTGFIMDYKARDDMHIWLADKHAVPFQVTIPYFDCAHWNSFNEAKEKGTDFFANHLNFEEKNTFYQNLFKLIPGVPEETKEYYFNCPGLAISTVLLENIGLYIENFSGVPYTDEENDTLMRFGKVFQQTYTRFLDLQKAEAQAREAQIETALEKVRSRSLAMHKSDELQDVVRTVFDRLNELDVRMNAASIFIFKEGSDALEQWVALAGHQYSKCFHLSDFNLPMFRDLKEARQQGKETFVKKYSFEEKNDWFRFAFEHTDYRQLSDERKRYLLESDCAVFAYGFTKNTGLQLANYDGKLLSENEIDILKRFAKVFEQAYTRFLDLQKAEAQAREAEIELVLERVRARTMAMQKSDELTDVAGLLFEQVSALGIKTWTAGFNVWSEDNNSYVDYITSPNGGFIEPYTVYTETAEALKDISNARKSGVEFDVQYVEGEKIKQLYLALTRLDEKQYEIMLQDGIRFPVHQYEHFVFGSKVSLMFITYEPVPEAHEIFQRLGKVFEQTYTRFLDLKKAEAQAREAQIEAALERVRSRSLAMHKTDELQQVVRVVAEELKNTGVILDTWGAVICTYFQNSKDVLHWTASEDPANPSIAFLLPYFEDVLFDEAWNSKDRGDSYFAKVFSFDVKNAFFKHAFEHSGYRQLPDDYKKLILESNSHGIAWAWAKNSAIMIPSIQGDLPSEESKEILIRFARVFEQSFIRFLDLEKAEAQARESQIQLALERVRARTMAMQKSDELQEVVNSVYEHLNELEVEMDGAAICTFIAETKDYHVWIGDYREPLRVQFNEFTQVQKDYNDAIGRREELFTHTYSGETKKEYIQFLLDQTVLGRNIPEEQKQSLLDSAFFTTSLACTKNTVFQLYRYAEKSFSKEDNDILKRFANVFEQSYTRFLDLQKAEAQAKEAQIETALEKVRSRSMAMHQSNDLLDVVRVLSDQLLTLGLKFDTASFAKIHEDGSWDLWISTPDQPYPAQIYVPYFNHPIFREVKEADDRRESFFERNYTLEEKNSFFTYFFENTAAKNIPDARKQYVLNCTGFARSVFLLKNIWLSVANYKGIPFSKEENAMLQRFANVFEQSYTRFLDLQKAEAQAREAQIEAALERVRSRTMAMQKSEDLNKAASDMFKQIQVLGMQPWACGFNIFDKNEKAVTQYMSLADGGISPPFRTPLTEDPFFINIYDARQRRDELLVMESSGESLANTYRYMFGLPGSREIFGDLESSGFEMPKFQITHCAYFSQGYLVFITYEHVSEAHGIFKRFAKVFEQTYTRFLDLQKAEAQAKESQIQLALERVRARTMAMHNSSELADTTGVLFQQFMNLGITPKRCLIGIMDKKNQSCEFFYTGFDGKVIPSPDLVPMNEQENLKQLYNAWVKNKDHLYFKLVGQQRVNWTTYIMNNVKMHFPEYEPDKINLKQISSVPAVFNTFFFTQGFIMLHTVDEIPEPGISILKRFSGVFEQTYTRFLDLKKAEAQGRESQIQLALERVRARTMAMQKSDELMETAVVLFNQLNQLGEHIERTIIGVMNEEERVVDIWATRPDGTQMEKMQKFPVDEPILMQKVYAAWQQQKKSIVIDLRNEELEHYFQFLKSRGSRLNRESFGERRVENFAFFSKGMLGIISADPNTPANVEVYERFAAVFDQTYTRFLDLQKSEAQAKESHIQLALERVRARTMAMQHSDELKDAAALLFQQAKLLGVPAYSCGYNIWEKEDKEFTSWMSTQDGSDFNGVPNIPLTEDANFIRYVESKQKGEQFFVLELRGERMQEHYEYLKTIPAFKAYFDYAESVGFDLPETQIHYLANFSQGNLLFITLEPCPEFHDVFKRFASVFEQTYTRFLDLQRAEAQSREAQIELGLERVRARAMAMQNSDELKGLIGTVFIELTKLDLVLTRCLIIIYDTQTNGSTWWMANSEAPTDPIGLYVKNHQLPPYVAYIKAWKERKNKWQYILEGKDKNDWDDFLFVETELSQLPDFVIAGMKAPDRVCLSASFNNFGCLNLASLEPLSDDHFDILLRFGKVFDLTYTRFNDLKQAEAQAREAKIEAALERVRGKAMSMHNSNDVSSTASLVFTELRKLGINPIRCGVGLLTKDSHKAQLYSATSSADGDSLALIGWVQLSDHPVLTKIYDTWLNDEEYYPELQGEEMQTYYQLLLKGLPVSVPDTTDSPKQYGHFIPFSIGCLYAWSETHYNESNIKILKRFASIIDLTFRRYIELQKSEANARDAIKQSALDRIRADIASMRTTTDLERITPLIWNELTILGISFIRCGIFIMDDSQELIHTFLSTPEGKAIAAFHLPYTTPGNISQVLRHWQNKKNYVDHWDESSFTEFAEILVEQGGLASAEQYLKTIPRGGFYLHFVPFLQGMLYVGNTTQLDEEEIKLIQSVADAFSTAYARYEDFNKLEFAKQHVEKTLVDLRQAQIQLIQSEKMASLGELTAGIAHEIQNPLNFVNNFSEVNAELLVELKDEISKGNMNEAKNIANDLIDNEQKINHHGKRADAIVKGMLQHSRISTGQKELTNINALADEYLRLAYHGMRAKDNFFSVALKTNFDEAIEKIKIIPQDIGRVILNLITNAFYAVNEKKKQQPDGYEPTICVSTKNIDGKVEIKVGDNGNGISQKVLDKIFQPFFTTKPTGQGTGLGLSLSYDIVKAHGGKIKVETKESEGSEFIIQLPV